MAREAEFGWPGGDRPGNLVFSYAPSEEAAEAIRACLARFYPRAVGNPFTLEALASPSGPSGRYRLVNSEGAWFIRVGMHRSNPELERSMLDYLARQHVPVNPLLVDGAPLEWQDETLRLDVRPFVPGHHFSGDHLELTSLASSLQACHRALRTFPRQDEVREAAIGRFEQLEQTRMRVSEAVERGRFEVFDEAAEWAAGHSRWIDELVQNVDLRWDHAPGAQCIHGEPHRANVLFPEEGGQAVLLDFEEATHHFAPPIWDLAFVVQRFCLYDDPSAAELEARLQAIERGYRARLPALAPTMRQIAWYTFLLLVHLRASQQIRSPLSEYAKFENLERQAATLVEL